MQHRSADLQMLYHGIGTIMLFLVLLKYMLYYGTWDLFDPAQLPTWRTGMILNSTRWLLGSYSESEDVDPWNCFLSYLLICFWPDPTGFACPNPFPGPRPPSWAGKIKVLPKAWVGKTYLRLTCVNILKVEWWWWWGGGGWGRGKQIGWYIKFLVGSKKCSGVNLALG